MYSAIQLTAKYLYYYCTAGNGKGHGIHSPFIFDFIKNVLSDKKQYPAFTKIEKKRKELLKDNTVIAVEDFGAGSSGSKTNRRKVKDIAASSLKPPKYAQLLYRIVQYYQPATVVELGTSFGITSAYLAAGNTAAQVYTCEGSSAIAAYAKKTFDVVGLKSISLTEGNFDDTLPHLLATLGQIDFVFIDGNHRRQPTVNYFNQLLNSSTENTVMVFDDIHWSKEMEQAWHEIKLASSVTCTIDLFFIGIVFFNKDFKSPQHFTLRF